MFLYIDFFFFNDTATPEIYTLSLHDALPISSGLRWKTPAPPLPKSGLMMMSPCFSRNFMMMPRSAVTRDRKSTRLNSSHANISYAVFCLKKKKEILLHDCAGKSRLQAEDYHN